MKRFKSLFATVALGLSLTAAVVTGCKKEAASPAPSQTSSSTSMRNLARETPANDAGYSANPYDSIGYQHNVMLQATRHVWADSSKTPEEEYAALIEYSNSNNVPVAIDFEWSKSLVNAVTADAANLQHNFLNTVGLSTQALSYARTVCSLANNVDGFGSYQAYRTAVVNVENNILTDGTLSETDKLRVLSGAAVARYSTLYWYRELLGYNGDITTQDNPVAEPAALPTNWGRFMSWFRDWCQKHPITVADICGAISGASGGWVGALLGGTAASILKAGGL